MLDASYGTRFHNFIDELVRIEVEYTYKYTETVGYPTHLGDTLTEKLLHIVTTSRFESIFEVIRHGATDAEVEAAAHAAGCDSFIGGLETAMTRWSVEAAHRSPAARSAHLHCARNAQGRAHHHSGRSHREC